MFGSQVDNHGNNMTNIKVAINMKKYGTQDLQVSVNEVLNIPETTKMLTPTGGVKNPM